MAARIVFMGSPDFSLPTLNILSQNFTITGVVTQPDRPAGRGRSLTPPPVKQLAIQLGIPIIQPTRLREAGVIEILREWDPDMIVVAAYGQILRQNILDLPPAGCLNVHASLLPRWRGASPIQFALLEGDHETGVSIMLMDAGLDTGPVLSQSRVSIDPVDTAASLGAKLAEAGADLLMQTLPDYLVGKIKPCIQDDSLATYARLLKKEDGMLDLSQPAGKLERQVRAFNPWPGAFILWQGEPLKILATHPEYITEGKPGDRLVIQKKPSIQTGDGLLILDVVQPAGKKPMPGSVFLNGARGWV